MYPYTIIDSTLSVRKDEHSLLICNVQFERTLSQSLSGCVAIHRPVQPRRVPEPTLKQHPWENLLISNTVCFLCTRRHVQHAVHSTDSVLQQVLQRYDPEKKIFDMANVNSDGKDLLTKVSCMNLLDIAV